MLEFQEFVVAIHGGWLVTGSSFDCQEFLIEMLVGLVESAQLNLSFLVLAESLVQRY